MVLKNLFAWQQWRKRHSEPNYGRGERGGEGKMYGESNMETYITICKIDIQWEFAVCHRKLKQGLCTILGGGMGREMGRRFKSEGIYVYLWLIHVEVWQKTKLCKALILQLKNKLQKKNCSNRNTIDENNKCSHGKYVKKTIKEETCKIFTSKC